MIQPVDNTLYLYRDDLFPFLGGGNKARKMMALHQTLRKKNYNALVTTGGIQSNHCRATALYCQIHNLKCTLVIHGNQKAFMEQLGNSKIIRSTKANLIFSEPELISHNMDNAMDMFKKAGFNPFYLFGGGHTMEGGKAYIDAVDQMVLNGFIPERIYVPSGTGSTQAGILAGITKNGLNTKVIGISVGRNKKRAEAVVSEFYQTLCKLYQISPIDGNILVEDQFLTGGYQKYNNEIQAISETSLANYHVLLDTTYSGKAFYGMKQLLKESPCSGNVLFWYTGGIYNYFSQ